MKKVLPVRLKARFTPGEKRARRALLGFRQLLASNIVGVVFWTLEGNILDANDLFLKTIGYNRDDLGSGRLNWKRLTPSEYTQVDEGAVSELVATGTCTTFEKEYMRKDGSRVRVLIGSALLDAHTQTGGSFVMDITERQRAKEQSERYTHTLQVLTRRLLEIQEEERRHLARELHDEIGQTLTAVKINLMTLAREKAPDVSSRIGDSVQLLDGLILQVRQLSLDLRPLLLDDLGLVEALRWLLNQQARRARLRVTFTACVENQEINSAVQTACFRVAQEAITNVIRHSGAKRITLNLLREADHLWLSVRDDGAGFDTAVLQRAAARPSSLGLVSMQERALSVRGGLEVHAAPGQGTEIRAWFPL